MERMIFSNLPPLYGQLLERADEIKDTAYCPYSGFHVGAALLTCDDAIITGSNVENAALGPTICAERSALVRANAMGIRTFKAIAVIARGRNFNTDKVTAPCGICRQMLYESAQLGSGNMDLILSNSARTEIVLTTISELLPLAFGPRDLGVDQKT